jgi:hypothetical protein
MMPVSETGWIYLGLSLLVATLVDFLAVRALVEFLRPTSTYLFLIGRVGKLFALLLWVVFLEGYWAPQFLPASVVDPQSLRPAVWIGFGLFVVLAGVTYPRAPRLRSETDG